MMENLAQILMLLSVAVTVVVAFQQLAYPHEYRLSVGRRDSRPIHHRATMTGGSVLIRFNRAIAFMAFDTDLKRVAQGKADGHQVVYGDITDPELLATVQVERASLGSFIFARFVSEHDCA